MSSIDAVLFDFDGVLVDSEPYWMEADRRLVEEAGRSLDPRAKAAVIGLKQDVAVRRLLELHGIEGDPAEFRRRREVWMEEYYSRSIPLAPSARETLARLRNRGLSMAVASSTPERLVVLSLDRHAIHEFFAHVVSAESVLNGKPAPDLFLKTATLLGVEPGRAVVVEDSMAGVLAAKAAGMRAVWVRNGHSPEAEQHADVAIDGLSALPGTL